MERMYGACLALFLLFIFVCGSVFLVGGCGGFVEKKTITKEVERILMHDPNEYSFLVENSETGVLDTLYVENRKAVEPENNTCYSAKGAIPKMYKDVPLGKKAWITFNEFYCSSRINYKNNPVISNLEIHIHSVSQINGAGWERSCGKGCIEKGATIPIE